MIEHKKFGLDEETLAWIEKYIQEIYGIQLGNSEDVKDQQKTIIEKIWQTDKRDKKETGIIVNEKDFLDWLVQPGNYCVDIYLTCYTHWRMYDSPIEALSDDMKNVIREIEMKKEFGEEGEKGEIGRYLPVILDNIPFETQNYKTKNFGRKYKEVMLVSDNNIEIYNVEKEKSKDISRYGYKKGKKIYGLLDASHSGSSEEDKEAVADEEVVADKLENFWLMEQTLGYGLMGEIYPYIKTIRKREELNRLDSILEYLCKVPYINMRKKVARIIFYYLRQEKFSEICIKHIENVMGDIVPKIKKCFWDLCILEWWYIVRDYRKGVDKQEEIEQFLVSTENEWNNQDIFWEISMDDNREQGLSDASYFSENRTEVEFLHAMMITGIRDEKQLKDKKKLLKAPEIIKKPEYKDLKPNVLYAEEHQKIVKYLLKNIKEDGLNFFSQRK